jgi:hypothetical protein
MSFFWKRPAPNYAVAEVVLVKPYAVRHWQPPRYMVIQGCRWIRPNGLDEKQWAYDGSVFEVVNDKLVWCANGSCFLEESLSKLHDRTP